MKHNYCVHREVREELRIYLKNLRDLAKLETVNEANSFHKVIFTEPRKGYFNNEYVDRLVLFLRGTGCSLAKETGGCTFCGFYNATNFGEKVPDEDYFAQINDVLNDENINFSQYPIICLYNDGSMLREEEISFNTFIKIMEILSEKSNVKKIVIESRVEDITEEKIAKMRAVTDKEIEIAVGYESANPLVRDLCINKGFENSIFEKNCKIAKNYGISIVPLVFLKPPFLTEQEAIDDYLNSLQYLEQFNLKRVDMELPTIENHTLVHELWKNNLYRPAYLWSVIKILQTRDMLGLKTPIYISPMVYSVSAEVKASNCLTCDNLIYKAFETYNQFGDVSIFDSIECSCKDEWASLLDEKNDEELPKRVRNILKTIKRSE
ncbi:MAG: archaeosine biosynthesis radical SAM protein RaSEA [Halanaerobiales bacterium]|nr:archaeosine biosynthesis radical SAM protein RaSEA [Halanaerobiales bacterium]